LEFYLLAVDFDYFEPEVDSDSWEVVLLEAVIGEPDEDGGLADAGAAHYHALVEVVVLFDHQNCSQGWTDYYDLGFCVMSLFVTLTIWDRLLLGKSFGFEELVDFGLAYFNTLVDWSRQTCMPLLDWAL
jgi:hypothetical protein